MLVEIVYWLHWALDILFVIACLSVIFRPMLWARVYVTAFLAQQLILDGCLMTWLQNVTLNANQRPSVPNMFIMSEVLSGPVIVAYKILFGITIMVQMYYIIKEFPWKRKTVISEQ